MHGPDFTLTLTDGTPLRAEVKKRSSTAGFATISKWMMGRDVLFIGMTNQSDDDALVVLRKGTFDRIVDADGIAEAGLEEVDAW